MSSRPYIVNQTANSQPSGQQLGDEWFNTGNNRLFKQVAVNGNTVTTAEVMVSVNNTASISGNIQATGNIQDGYGNVRSVPINTQTASYTLTAADNGRTISITTGGVTVPASVMNAGDVVSIYNNSLSNQTITQGAGLTLQWAGQPTSTTGNRTIGLYGLCSVIFITPTSAVISGAGLT